VATRRVVVAGGGIAGLATAFRLRQAASRRGIQVEVIVLEREQVAGGKVATLREQGFLCEAGPAGFLDNEPATLRLVDDLGLRGELVRSSDASRERFILRGGRMHALAMRPLTFLRSPLLSWRGRLRVVAELWQPPRRYPDLLAAGLPALSAIGGVPPAIPLEQDETVGAFGRRRLGPEFTAVLLDPMVSGIYAGDVDRLSLAAAFPKVVELERKHGGLLRGMQALKKQRRKSRRRDAAGRAGEAGCRTAGEAGSEAGGGAENRANAVEAGPGGVLHTFRSGMAAPIEALVRQLGGRAVRTAQQLRTISDYGPRGGFRVTLEGLGGQGRGETFDCDALVLAMPADAAAQVLRDYAAPAAEALAEIGIAGVHVACLGYRREQVSHPLHGFGVLIPRREGVRVLGTIWSSSTFVGQAPQDQVLLRTLVGGTHDPQASTLSDAQLVELVRRETEPLYGVRGEPSYVRVFRWPLGIPQYEVGHLQRVARARQECARHPGLFLTGNSVCGISFNNCVAHAEVVAEQVVEFLAPAQAASAARPALAGAAPAGAAGVAAR
jgi:oxygen-dependent protoporphyrinogen oxidase